MTKKSTTSKSTKAEPANKRIEQIETLIEAGKIAFKQLLEAVESPIADDLQDDKKRNAMKAKKECFMDAQAIISEVHKLESQLEGNAEEESVDEAEFKGGATERWVQKRNSGK